MRVLVTGARGFVGHALIHDFAQKGFDVVAAIRNAMPDNNGVYQVIIGDINPHTDWTIV